MSPERDHPSGVQRQVLSGGRVPSSPRRFRLDGKLPEPADQDIVTRLQGFLDQFENVIDQGLRLLFGESDLIIEGLDQVFFHVRVMAAPPVFYCHRQIHITLPGESKGGIPRGVRLVVSEREVDS
jgi:hypothetical protein